MRSARRPAASLGGMPAFASILAGPLSARSGFWSTLGRARQLVRLSYYADPATHARLGFVPAVERVRLPRAAARPLPEEALVP